MLQINFYLLFRFVFMGSYGTVGKPGACTLRVKKQQSLQIQPHLKRVATPPCEILGFKNCTDGKKQQRQTKRAHTH